MSNKHFSTSAIREQRQAEALRQRMAQVHQSQMDARLRALIRQNNERRGLAA